MPITQTKPLSIASLPAIVEVLADAFHDYPVMRYVLGASGAYEERLRSLVRLFATRRFLFGDPVLGISAANGELLAVALATAPGEHAATAASNELRAKTWGALGADAQSRYEAFAAATETSAVRDRHHHLNMIGVRTSERGTGLARPLLVGIHELARADPHSTGVSLTTEHAQNLTLYAHFGYQQVGHARVSPELETWTLFRPRDAKPIKERK